MFHRSIQAIYPANAEYALTEDDVRRACSAHVECAQRIEDLYWWINQEVNPFNQEAYAEGMRAEMLNRMRDPYDNKIQFMRDYQWEEVMHRLDLIIRKAQVDELHWIEEESESAEPVPQQELATTPVVVSLQSQIDVLKKQVKSIIDDLTVTPLIWPMYTAHANEGDKKVFEKYLKELCTESSRNVTAQVKSYLRMKEEEGLINRPTQITEEWRLVRKFRYPYALKTYQNS